MSLFVVIEGTDAAGKNTQSKLLAERMRALGLDVELHSFPRYGTPLGEAILRHLRKETRLVGIDDARHRDDPMVFQCMMLADKYDAAVTIKDELEAGKVVITDRWWQSAFAYGASDGLDEVWLDRIHKSLPQGHANVFLDVPAEEAARRRPEARDRYEEAREQQTDIRNRYMRLWSERKGYRKIDGTRSIEEVSTSIWAAVAEVNAYRSVEFVDDEEARVMITRHGDAADVTYIPEGDDSALIETMSLQDIASWARDLAAEVVRGPRPVEIAGFRLRMYPDKAREVGRKVLALTAI